MSHRPRVMVLAAKEEEKEAAAAAAAAASVSVFCTEKGGEDCGHCLSLPTSHNCGWCSSIKVCTTLTQCNLNPLSNHQHQDNQWFAGDTMLCSQNEHQPQEDNNNVHLRLFIGLAVMGCVIVSLILIILVILLKKTTAEARENSQQRGPSSSCGIDTWQKRIFGRKNSQKMDPLPVVLLSYKADYDEMLPVHVHASSHRRKRDSSLLYAIIDKKVSTPSSSFQGTMIFNQNFRRDDNPLRKHQTVPHINRLSLLWNNSNESALCTTASDSSSSINAYSPLPISLERDMKSNEAKVGMRSEHNDSILPISCQTNLMQMSSNQYYLVVQINVNESVAEQQRVYENLPMTMD